MNGRTAIALLTAAAGISALAYRAGAERQVGALGALGLLGFGRAF